MLWKPKFPTGLQDAFLEPHPWGALLPGEMLQPVEHSGSMAKQMPRKSDGATASLKDGGQHLLYGRLNTV